MDRERGEFFLGELKAHRYGVEGAAREDRAFRAAEVLGREQLQLDEVRERVVEVLVSVHACSLSRTRGRSSASGTPCRSRISPRGGGIGSIRIRFPCDSSLK